MEEETWLRPKVKTIHDYLRILVRRRWTILAVFIGVVSLTALRTLTTTPIYRATVQLLIESNPPKILESTQPQQFYFDPEKFYQTQYNLLQSRALAKKVAEKLNLKNRLPYSQMFSQLPENVDTATKKRLEESLANAVAGSIEVTPIEKSSLVNVSYLSPDPKFAAEGANTLAQAFIEQSLDLRFAASQEAAEWLKHKLGEARKKLEESETRLNQYKRQHNIVTIEDKESITAQKLEQLNRELVSAQTRRMEAETRLQEVTAGRPIAEVLNNPLIQTLRAEEAKLTAEQSELSKRFGEGHPRMIQLREQLGATRGKINAEMAMVKQTIKNEYNMAKAQEENLRAAMERQKTVTQDQSDVGIQYRVLLRDVETNRALYENMLKSLTTTTATENLPAMNIRIVFPALVPEVPISPRVFHDLIMAMGIGLFLGVGLALFLEHLDTTIKTPEEVEKWLEIPNLALIPHIDTKSNPVEVPELVFSHDQQPQASEAYRVLRTNILFASPQQPPRVLLITSTLPEEGKTLTVVNLATAMAKAEGDVLIIDADLRRPTLHKLLNVSQKPGLTDFLTGETDELPVVTTPVPHLFLISAGTIPSNPSELLGSKRMRSLLDQAQERFLRVILDSPPLLSVTDAAILSTQMEGVLLVIKAGNVPRKVARDAKDHLLELHAPLLGAFLNNVPLHREGYYYSHYRYYSSYYTDTKTSGDKEKKKDRRTPGLWGWVSRWNG